MVKDEDESVLKDYNKQPKKVSPPPVEKKKSTAAHPPARSGCDDCDNVGLNIQLDYLLNFKGINAYCLSYCLFSGSGYLETANLDRAEIRESSTCAGIRDEIWVGQKRRPDFGTPKYRTRQRMKRLRRPLTSVS